MAAAPVLLFLTACSAQPDAPVDLTVDDQRQLNEAAAMLDDDSIAPGTVFTNERSAP